MPPVVVRPAVPLSAVIRELLELPPVEVRPADPLHRLGALLSFLEFRFERPFDLNAPPGAGTWTDARVSTWVRTVQNVGFDISPQHLPEGRLASMSFLLLIVIHSLMILNLLKQRSSNLEKY